MFSIKDVNILLKLDGLLKTSLSFFYWVFDLILIALGNEYNCHTIIYEYTRTNLWTIDLSKDNGNYEKTLYFVKTDFNDLDVVTTAEPTDRNWKWL